MTPPQPGLDGCTVRIQVCMLPDRPHGHDPGTCVYHDTATPCRPAERHNRVFLFLSGPGNLLLAVPLLLRGARYGSQAFFSHRIEVRIPRAR